MASDVIALMDHLDIERADIMGYSLGSRMTAMLAREPAAAAALGDPRRHRDRPDRGRRPRRERRQRAGSAVAGGRHRSGRADVSRLRRPDPLRSPRARRLPARFAAADDAEEAAGISVPVLIAVGTKDEIAGSAAGARENHSGRRGARHSEPRPHARGRRQGLQGGRHRFPVAAAMSGRAASSPVKCLTAAISTTDGRKPGHARAVAIVRA